MTEDPNRGQSIFTRGAVDLSALRAPSTVPDPAPDSPAPADDGGDTGVPRFAGQDIVVDVTVATFQRDVVERSRTIPVILEFVARGQYAGDPALEQFAQD